uniref:hemagglutinin repeat-containing protein n=1 Tax=Selenobaculum sp. TaxID=3074374 RepID=UPI003AB13BAA
AKGNLDIQASTNKNTSNTDSKSSSASIGVSINLGDGSIGAIGVSASKATGKIKENAETYNQSTITAKDTLTTKSGQDTNIIGSKLEGDTVKMEVGNNLKIESLQDKETYDEKNKSVSISISAGSINGSASQGKTNSNYESVTDQAGIHAGQGGFDIEVSKNTDLKGAVIASEATPDKNKLSTDTLTYSDIENKAEYSASSIGVAYEKGTKDDQHKRQEGWRPEVSPVSQEEASSIAQSGIAEGSLEIRADKNKAEQDKTNRDGLNQNPSSDYQGLTKIFDENKIKEQQELSSLFAQLSYEQIGKIARDNHWAEGSIEKVLLHGAIGAIVSEFAGGNVLAGAAGSSVNEIVNGYIAKWEFENKKDIDPSLRRVISLAVGNVVGGLWGDSKTGGSTAWMGTQYNALSSEPVEVKIVVYDQDLLHCDFGHTSLVIDNKEVNYGRYVPESEDELRLLGGTIGEGAVIIENNADAKIKESRDNGEIVKVYTLNISNSESAKLVQVINDELENGWRWTSKEENIPSLDSAYRFTDGTSYQEYVLWKRNCTTFVVDMLKRALPQGDTRLKGLDVVVSPCNISNVLDWDASTGGYGLVK